MDPQLANLDLDPPRQPSLLRRGLLPALLVNAVFFAGVALSLHWPWGDAGDGAAATRVDADADTKRMGAAPAMAPAPAAATESTPTPQPSPPPMQAQPPQAAPQPPPAVPSRPSANGNVPVVATPMGSAAQAPAPARAEPASRPEPRPRRAAAATDASVTRQATGVAVQPSFDCGKARSRTERLICGDPELAQLDRDTGRLHARARAAAHDAAAFKRLNDREWKQREAQCRDKACLLAWYARRRAQLQQTVAQSR